MHSICSDGSYAPEALVALASKIGLKAIALTDHDTVSGVDAFLAACEKISAETGSTLRGVTGVEISTDSRLGGMHLLGYLVDHHHPELLKAVETIRGERTQRNQAILRNLNERGFNLGMERISAMASGDVVGRPHFARALLEDGHVSSLRQAFDQYLGVRGSCYVSGFRFPVDAAIAAIHATGGVAVLAHPVTFRLGANALDAFVGELKTMGLDGIEVFYPEHTPQSVRAFRRLAEKYNLAMTGGSDFHGAANPAIQMGRGFGDLDVSDALLDGLEARRGGGLRPTSGRVDGQGPADVETET